MTDTNTIPGYVQMTPEEFDAMLAEQSRSFNYGAAKARMERDDPSRRGGLAEVVAAKVIQDAVRRQRQEPKPDPYVDQPFGTGAGLARLIWNSADHAGALKAAGAVGAGRRPSDKGVSPREALMKAEMAAETLVLKRRAGRPMRVRTLA